MLPRRIHTPILRLGEIDLSPAQAHHLRDVLRLKPGDAVEAFDDAGAVGRGTVLAAKSGKVTIGVAGIVPAGRARFSWSVAAAVPKGPRGDWMVEKLSELGASAFIPLITARGVRLPGGPSKTGRWSRLAAQAAGQSGRTGVMRITPLTPLADVIGIPGADQAVWFLSTDPDARPLPSLLAGPLPEKLLMLIGPEGGWTDSEISLFQAAGLKGAKLTHTTLRIETAAIAAAAVAAVWAAALDGPADDGDHPLS